MIDAMSSAVTLGPPAAASESGGFQGFSLSFRNLLLRSVFGRLLPVRPFGEGRRSEDAPGSFSPVQRRVAIFSSPQLEPSLCCPEVQAVAKPYRNGKCMDVLGFGRLNEGPEAGRFLLVRMSVPAFPDDETGSCMAEWGFG